MLLQLCLLCHYSKTAPPPPLHSWLLEGLLKEAWDLAAIVSLWPGLTQRPAQAAGTSQVGQNTGLTPAPVESPHGLFFFTFSLAKSGNPHCSHRPTWQLPEEPDPCQPVRGFSCSQAGVAAVKRAGRAHAVWTAALYICHVKLRAPILALYQLLACC